MAKNSVTDWSETAADNTDLKGIPLTNSAMYPSDARKFAQEVMAQIKAFFKASLFRLRDTTDQTKLLAFDISQFPTGTERTITLPPEGLPAGYPLIHVQDQKSNGTSGGASGTTTFQRRTLNTVVTNEITGALLSADRVNLPAGTYYFEASAPGYRVDRHRIGLRNDTSATYIAYGPTEYTLSSQDAQTTARLSGRFVLSGTADIEISHYTQTATATNGLGVSCSSGATAPEIYSDLKIWRLK